MALGTRMLLLGLVAVTVTSGCGRDPEYNAPAGVVRSEQVNVLNATLVTDGDGDIGTLVGTLLNEAPEADTLTDIEVTSEFGDTETILPEGPIDLPTDEIVRLAVDELVVVTGEDLRPGYFIEIAYEFEDAPTLRDVIPVSTNEGEFDDVEVPDPEEYAD